MAKTNNLNAMLIAGETGLSENMTFRTDLISNPIMERMSKTLNSNAEKAKAITANINKATEKVDEKTGEIVKDITDNKLRNVVYRLAAGFKSMFAASGGEGEDVIMGEYDQVANATDQYLADKKAFQDNINGDNYSAGSSEKTYDANENVHGGNYIGEPMYNSATNQLMFLVPVPQGDYGNTDAQLDADYEEYVEEMKGLESEPISEDQKKRLRELKNLRNSNELTPELQEELEILQGVESGGILNKADWAKQQGIINTGDNKTELEAGRAGYQWVDLSELNKNVVLKDADLMTVFEEGLEDIYNTGSSNKNVQRNDDGSVKIKGIDLEQLAGNDKTLVTMAWDNYIGDGGGTFVETWQKNNPGESINWARIDHPDYDKKRLKKEVKTFYQEKIDKKYQSGADDYKNNTQGAIKVEEIDTMIDNAFSSGPGPVNEVDYSFIRTDRRKVDMSKDGTMYEVLSWENGDWVLMEDFPVETSPELLKRYFKIAMGGSIN